MMRWSVLIFCLLAGPTLAQQINVRSGAHDGFARLVLDVPAGTTWSLDENASGARLTLDGHKGGFDTSAIFSRIDRSFVSGVTADQNGINVEFSCDCIARVFSQGSRMIVMDVSGSPETAPPRLSGALDSPFVGDQPFRFQSQIAGGPNQPRSPEPPSRQPGLRTPPEPRSFDEVVQFGAETPTEPSNPANLRVAQQKLAQQIGRAATHGILSPTQRNIDLPMGSPGPQIDTRIFDSSLDKPVVDALTEPLSGNLRITSSDDIPLIGDLQDQTSTALGVPCIDPARLAVQTWGSETGLSAQTASLRGKLYTEFDRLDPEVAIALARAYLHYGFGLEARQILLLDEKIAQTNAELIGMAEIMEYGHVRGPGFLEHFVDCDSDAALWAILSLPVVEPTRTINVSAALLALSGLPMHLRGFVAPELSRRLLAYGDEDGAAAALRSLERTAEPLNPNANLAKADLEMAQGKVDQAQERLAEVVTSNAEQSAEALIKFVNSHLDADAEIDEDVATLVEAYALEMRDDPIGDELRRAHVLALGKSGQFSAAFEALSRVRARSTDLDEDPLRSSVLDLLTRSADDVEFLDHAFLQMAIAPETISPKSRFHLAERLMDLGFPEQAEAVIGIAPGYPNSSKSKILNARISLALSRPSEALAHLFGEESEVASMLRAEAELRAGEFADAHAIYARVGDQTGSQRAAWLSDEWSVLVEDGAPVFGPLVQVSKTSVDIPSQAEGMLKRTEETILESRDARQVIENLLQSEELGVTDVQ